jgi:hypothetical protein
MRTELTYTYPVALKNGFDYLDDFRMWPDWYVGMLGIIDPETCAWAEPGDKVRFAYKLLGRRIEGTTILESWHEAELIAYHTEVPGLPVVHFEYHYSTTEPETFTLRVVMETEEPTSFFGRTIDRMLLPRVLERDLRHSMENLADIFAIGLPG